MFFDIDVAASFGSPDIRKLIIAGGTQDNASMMTDFQGSGIGYVPPIPSCNSGLIRLWVCIFALNCSSTAPSINSLQSTSVVRE